MSGRERLRDRARQALGVLRAFSLRHGELELRFDVDAIAGRADSGDLEEDIVDLIAELGETARDAGTGVVFLMDEIQFLSRADLEALIAAMHRASQRNLPVTIVGAGLPLLPRLSGEARSYAERLFDFRSIGSLPDADAKEALLIPAREENAEWENAALELALDYTEAYPYFLQEYGKHAWLEAPEPPIS